MRPEAYVRFNAERSIWIANYHGNCNEFTDRNEAVDYVAKVQSQEFFCNI